MINALIDKRYSPRTFSNQPVDEEKIMELFQAASYAASSRNEQPWRFIYATKENPEEYQKLFNCLNDWNQKWAKLAPVLIIAVAKMNAEHKNYPNQYARYDVGQAVATLALQAVANDLYMHQMGGFSPEKAKASLNIPDGYEAVTAIALGYLGEVNDLDEEYRKIESSERTRKPLKEFVFKGSWK